MILNNCIYDDSRSFAKVFETFDLFAMNTIPYVLDQDLVDLTNLEIIYNRLKLQYWSSYYAYERIGTIYQKNVERITKMLIILKQYNELKLLVNEKASNVDISEFYDTDNEENSDVIGSLTSKSNHKSLNTDNYNKLIIKQTNLLSNLDREIEKYQVLFLNEINYNRGDGRIYE